jgi:hypothetical protein
MSSIAELLGDGFCVVKINPEVEIELEPSFMYRILLKKSFNFFAVSFILCRTNSHHRLTLAVTSLRSLSENGLLVRTMIITWGREEFAVELSVPRYVTPVFATAFE